MLFCQEHNSKICVQYAIPLTLSSQTSSDALIALAHTISGTATPLSRVPTHMPVLASARLHGTASQLVSARISPLLTAGRTGLDHVRVYFQSKENNYVRELRKDRAGAWWVPSDIPLNASTDIAVRTLTPNPVIQSKHSIGDITAVGWGLAEDRQVR